MGTGIRRQTLAGSDAPAQGGRMNRRVPEPDEVVVELQEGDREAGHLEAGDVVADQAPPDRDPLSAEDLRDAVERDVELDERRAAHSVDEGEDVVAAAQTEIRDDRREEPLGHVVDRGELLPAPAGLAVDPDPDLDLVVAEGER